MNFADRVKDVTTSTGTGPFTLSGTPPAGGYQAIGAIGPTGTVFPYAASQGNLWEVGLATITAANTVSRAPSASSSAGALVAFTAGADFICTPTAQAFNSIQSGAAIAVQSLTTTAGTITIPFSVGLLETAVALTLTQNVAITIGNGATGFEQRMSLELIQDATGGRVVTFVNPSWAGSVAPTLDTSPNRHNTVAFRALGIDVQGAAYSINRVVNVPAAPSAPQGVTVTPGNALNTINATPVTANPVVTGYNVYRGTSAGAESATPIASGITLPYVDSGLANGTTYYYKLAAVNTVGVGAQSSEGSATPAAGALPGAPASITVTPGDTVNVVSAAAVTSTPSVTGYTVYRGTTTGGESATAIATNVALPYSDTGRTNGTTYFYKVAAVNANGTGAQSAEGSGTPAAASNNYATLSGDGNIYTTPNAAFSPGAQAFDMQARVSVSSWTGGSRELFGTWDTSTAAKRQIQLYIDSTGALVAMWATGSNSFAYALSSVIINAAVNSPVWLRATVVPTTGVVTFYTSLNGATWTQLGTTVTAASPAAVYTPTTPNLPYMVIGQQSGGGLQFAGDFYAMRLYINGALITSPTVTASTTAPVADAAGGYTYNPTTSGGAVVYH